jgi:hypothetical protein
MTHKLLGITKTKDVYLDGKYLDPGRSQKIWNHSPDGFNWGYSGSGPAQLALAILLEIKGSPNGYQIFKDEVIAAIPMDKDFNIEFEL